MSDDYESTDLFEDLPTEFKHLIEKSPTYEVIEETLSVNLNDENNPKIVQIGTTLNKEESEKMIDLLKEFQDVFAWSYADMPGIDPTIVQHHIPLLPSSNPVKQKLRRMRPDWALKVKEEVEK